MLRKSIKGALIIRPKIIITIIIIIIVIKVIPHAQQTGRMYCWNSKRLEYWFVEFRISFRTWRWVGVFIGPSLTTPPTVSELTSASLSSRRSTISLWPSWAATWRWVQPSFWTKKTKKGTSIWGSQSFWKGPGAASLGGPEVDGVRYEWCHPWYLSALLQCPHAKSTPMPWAPLAQVDRNYTTYMHVGASWERGVKTHLKE